MSPAFRAVLVVSGLLKIVLAVSFANLEPRYDETEYLEFGPARFMPAGMLDIP